MNCLTWAWVGNIRLRVRHLGALLMELLQEVDLLQRCEDPLAGRKIPTVTSRTKILLDWPRHLLYLHRHSSFAKALSLQLKENWLMFC